MALILVTFLVHKRSLSSSMSSSLDASESTRRLGVSFRMPESTTGSSRTGRPPLKFQDLNVGAFVGSGSINAVFDVTLPEWAYDDDDDNDERPRLVLKLTTDLYEASREIHALRTLNSNAQLARDLNVLPLYYSDFEIPNPYYCPKEKPGMRKTTTACLYSLPDSFVEPDGVSVNFQDAETIGAIVVPYLSGNFILQDFESLTLGKIRIFLQSLLEQLEYAHSLGINNLDLSVSRNIYVHPTTSHAILFDWNGSRKVGDLLYGEDYNMDIVPPEGWIQTYDNGTQLYMTSVYDYDVWQVGILLARILHAPRAVWVNADCIPNPLDRLQATLESIPGSAIVPVGNGPETIDLARVAGMENHRSNGNSPSSPVLCKKHKNQVTGTSYHYERLSPEDYDPTSFSILKAASVDERTKVLDLLQSMLKVSPLDRPTCATLLQHPFFRATTKQNRGQSVAGALKSKYPSDTNFQFVGYVESM